MPPPQQAPAPPRVPLSEGAHEVVSFLKEVGLEAYSPVLLENGFDDMETLMSAEDADLRAVGVPFHHIARLHANLQSRRGEDELDPSNPVVQFLHSIGLEKYAGVLLRSGFDDMEALSLIEDADFKDLGVARGHAIKIRKRLQKADTSSASSSGGDPPMIRTSVAPTPEGSVISDGRPPTAGGASPTGFRRSQGPQPPHVAGPPTTLRPPTTGPRKAWSSPTIHEHDGNPRRASSVSTGPWGCPKMKSAVERSWDLVKAHGSYTMGELLFRHTLILEPAATALFPLNVRIKYQEWTEDGMPEEETDIWDSNAMRKLFSKVVNAIGCTVAGLNDVSKLVPMLTKLGARHINYGPSEEHWKVLGKALDLTLQDILQDDYTREVQGAWTAVYAFTSSIMIDGLRRAKEEAAERLLEEDEGKAQDGHSSAASTDQDGEDQATLATPSGGSSGEQEGAWYRDGAC